ncbi:hypothetical protein GCK32_006112 [Trichostrongylus colubriformis]|uniref:C2H2-type domain-containing protein n=1 Tax=Trichostrongylus colubriformis TaxID=6319 RepID=A0AAN8FV42_TRICO
MDFAELMPMSASSPVPIAVSDPNDIQQFETDDSHTLTDLDHYAESSDQYPVNAVDYANGLFEGLDYEGPSTSRCKTNTHLDRLCENGVYASGFEHEDQDIEKYYYMTEDSFEDVIAQLEQELQREEKEAQEKAAETEKLIKEMEESAKNFTHVRKLMKERDKHTKAAVEVAEEKQRIMELKREMAIANKKTELFCCFVCCKVFLDEEMMRQHVSEKHLASKKRHKYYCGARQQIAERRRKAREELDAMSSITSVSSPPGSVISTSSGAASTISIGSASGRPVKDKSCPFCFLVCASMQSRRRHIERKHPEKINDPKVDEIGYVKVVSPALPYACNICSKTFASHASMSTHKKRIHENMNMHECSTCGRSYPLASELRKHIKRVHEKDLEYVISQKVALSHAQ